MCLQMMQILQKMMSEVILQMRLNLFRQSCSRLTDVCSWLKMLKGVCKYYISRISQILPPPH